MNKDFKNSNKKHKKPSAKSTTSMNNQMSDFISPNRPGVEYRKVEQKPSSVKKQPRTSGTSEHIQKSSQNFANRQAVVSNQEAARRLAVLAQRKHEQKLKRKKALKNALGRAVAVVFFSLIGAALCTVSVIGFLWRDFNKATSEKTLPVEVLQSQYEKNAFLLSSDNCSYSSNEYYISLPALSERLGFSILGDVKKMTLKISENDSAVFEVGSTLAEINGNKVSLNAPTYFSGGALYVPASFFTSYLNSVTFEATKSKINGHVFRLSFPEVLSFTCLNTTPTEGIRNSSVISAMTGEQAPEFTIDLSEYEKYMNPENRDEYLILINTENMLSSDYVPDDLTDFIYTRGDRAKQKLRLYAAKSLEAMFKEMYAAGFSDVTVTSGYRSYDYQTTLFNNEVASLRGTYGDNAEKKAAEAVAIPGSSEHQSGLCADLHNLSAASTAFEKQDAYKWLYSHCADFGFILRFPKDKTDITGIMFEPWHYRYVGRYHAQKIMSSGMCLEEYYEQYTKENH